MDSITFNYCECGCGTEVKNRFVSGHNVRTYDRSGDQKKLWQDPIYSKHMSDVHMGQEAWNKDIPCREETKEKLRKKLKGRETWNKGVKATDEHRKNLSIAHMGLPSGMKGKNHTQKTKDGISEKKKGKNHHMYGKTHSEETIQKMKDAQDERYADIESRIKLSCWHQEISREEWTDFIGQEPYCSIWTEEFKEMIKERDGYKCLNPDCWKTSNRICGHHIDYNKKNCNPWNIISLCLSCNSRANKDRDKWQKFYTNIMKERGLN